MTDYTSLGRKLLSGNEAVAFAALHGGVTLGTGYPGTPSTEILEEFSLAGGQANWSPNEKIALEVGIGVAFAGGRALVTMKHVGLNVAADAFFSAAYTGVDGALVIISADDPGMLSSQNEQDNRRYAVAAGVPMLEPADSQEAYDFTTLALQLSEEWHVPVLLRLTTRVCHSVGIVDVPGYPCPPVQIGFNRDIKRRVMIPAHARPAHRRLREKLARIQAWSEASGLHQCTRGNTGLGIITSGVASLHVREAAPEASVFKVAMSYPLPIEQLRAFAGSVARCMVIEEGDPYLVESLRMAGVAVEDKPEAFRFGELTVNRVRRILNGDLSPEFAPPPGKPPELCAGCPHRMSFMALSRLDCIVSGDIGCYTLGALPPYEAMDSQLCMGASIGIGLGLRHTLPDEEARRVVSVIGDSTFFHSGLAGLAEMVYNPPKTGHIVLILDNGTTAMTGLQEHAGTGRALDHGPARGILPEDVARAMGIQDIRIVDYLRAFQNAVADAMTRDDLTVIVMRQPCRLLPRPSGDDCEEDDDE